MKFRTLAAAVALLQLGAGILPTAAALAGEHGHGHDKEWRGGDKGGDRGDGGDRDNGGRDWRGGDDGDRHDERRAEKVEHREYKDRDRGWERPAHWSDHDHDRGPVVLPFYHDRDYYVPEDRVRYYRDITVVRPHGQWYSGYGHYDHDDDALPFLAFAAITLGILDLMNEHQQRALEDAQIRATRTPIGVPIRWNNGDAYGTVTPTRDGRDADGRYCREFQQKVKVGGQKSQAYGTACRQPDGTWQIVSTH